MNIEINKITLKINDQELELTLEQCEELRKILDKVIEKKPEFTISSQWPNGDGTINVPWKLSDYPFPNPVVTWYVTNNDYEITSSSVTN